MADGRINARRSRVSAVPSRRERMVQDEPKQFREFIEHHRRGGLSWIRYDHERMITGGFRNVKSGNRPQEQS